MKQYKFIDDLISDLTSADLQTQVHALEAAAELIQNIAQTAVQGLQNSSNAVITIDRIALLGPVVIPALEQFITNSEKGEKRTLASILLLSLGSTKGLADVLESVKNGDENQFIATSKLADAGITEAGDLIIERLRNLASAELFNREQSPKFVNLLSALEKLKVALPAELKEQLSKPEVPYEISGMLKKT